MVGIVVLSGSAGQSVKKIGGRPTQSRLASTCTRWWFFRQHQDRPSRFASLSFPIAYRRVLRMSTPCSRDTRKSNEGIMAVGLAAWAIVSLRKDCLLLETGSAANATCSGRWLCKKPKLRSGRQDAGGSGCDQIVAERRRCHSVLGKDGRGIGSAILGTYRKMP